MNRRYRSHYTPPPPFTTIEEIDDAERKLSEAFGAIALVRLALQQVEQVRAENAQLRAAIDKYVAEAAALTARVEKLVENDRAAGLDGLRYKLERQRLIADAWRKAAIKLGHSRHAGPNV